MVGTGQTGLIQGARYGIALDAIPAQFCSGEMEATIVEAFEGENPDVIIVEGQGALSPPAYLTSAFILRGSRPDGVVLQHAPGRTRLSDFGELPFRVGLDDSLRFHPDSLIDPVAGAVLLRHGLLATIAMFAFHLVLLRLVSTLDLSAWYGRGSMVTLPPRGTGSP